MPDLTHHIGTWRGTSLTFIEPGELYDESPILATVEADGEAFVIDYTTSIKDQDVKGTLRWSETEGTVIAEWVDSWHTSGACERLEVSGGRPPMYRYTPQETWTWDITIDATPDGFVVTHHNAGPGVDRHVGVRMELQTRTG